MPEVDDKWQPYAEPPAVKFTDLCLGRQSSPVHRAFREVERPICARAAVTEPRTIVPALKFFKPLQDKHLQTLVTAYVRRLRAQTGHSRGGWRTTLFPAPVPAAPPDPTHAAPLPLPSCCEL